MRGSLFEIEALFYICWIAAHKGAFLDGSLISSIGECVVNSFTPIASSGLILLTTSEKAFP